MGDNSKIEWTQATWNPIRGCSRVSEGCRNCYAERVAARFSKPGMPYEGLAVMKENGPHWTGKVRLVEEHLDDPLKWRKPRRVFVNSMSDLFHEGLDDFDIQRVFDVMYNAERHTYQILTKRARRMHDYLNAHRGWWGEYPQWRHVWLGVSVEDQKTADERIPLLLRTPAAVRWLSMEPLLGPVDISPYLPCGDCRGSSLRDGGPCQTCWGDTLGKVDWVVVGGESGSGARPMHPDWARSLRDQCEAAGVPFFFKQWGAYVETNSADDYNDGLTQTLLPDGRFGNYGATIPNGGAWMKRVNKKAAGRLLDGREWNQFPG